MPLEGGCSQNIDKTMNCAVSGVKEVGDVSVTAGAFVNNYRAEVNPYKPNAPPYSVAGASIGVEHVAGHGASVSAQHIPTFGNQATVAATANVFNNDNHRVDVNAFTTHNMPKVGPAFQTHGGGVDYQYKEKFNAGASVSHTPMYKQTDYSVSSGVALHRTPTSSLDLNIGARRTDTPLRRGDWQPGAFLGFKKNF